MTRALLTWAAVAATAAIAGTPVQSGHDLYQQALVKERAEGNLQQAIDLYERIAHDFPDDHALAAKALVQMGQCYEKLGQAGAKKAYERVIRDYADQVEPLQVARARLAALTRVPGHDMAVRRVWSDPTVDVGGTVSPDGRSLSFVDWETGDLAVRDLATGQSRRLTSKGTWEDSPEFATFSRWSPDGRQIAYDWWSPGHPSQLRVIDLESLRSRALYPAREGADVVALDWSPDGKEILVAIQGPDEGQRMAAVSLADGAARTIKHTDGRFPPSGMAEYSPDGRHILYSDVSRGGSLAGDVFILSSDGRVDTPVVDHPANDMAAGWSPDGSWILFLSDRTGSLDLWTLPVKDGEPTGAPRLVKAGTGRITSLGFDDSGRFYYGTWSRARDVYTATLDPETGRILSAPSRMVRRFQGLNSWPSYSRDGRHVSYVSGRGTLTAARASNTVLCIRSLESGQERELPMDFQRLVDPQFSADGKSVFVGAFGELGGMSIYRIDATTKEKTLVVEVEQDDVRITSYEVSPDGKALFLSRCEKAENACRLLKRDLASGVETEIHRIPGAERVNMALAPDGGSLAFLERRITDATRAERAIRVVPASGGTPREIHRFTAHTSRWIPLEFSAGGDYVLMPSSRDETTWSLTRVPVGGGEPQELGLHMAGFGSLSAHPDGQDVAFDSWDNSEAEVWVIEDLLSRVAARP